MSEIYTTKEFKKVLLIVGNGFDLNLELKTSYNHFLSSLSTDELNNDLIYELNLRNKNLWVDIEKELEDCTINGLTKIKYEYYDNFNSKRSPEIKKKDYEQLKSLLKKHLITEQKELFKNFKII